MKKIFITMLLGISTLTTFAQNASTDRYTTHNKGKFFFYWGGNRAYYTNSDITFSGNNYNFTIKDVEAVDKPKGWHIDYINPLRMTIPQTNFHIGYHISDHYTISVGVDHMKYVMKNGQTVKMNGYINGSNTSHDGTYNNTDKLLSEDFLTFEHTDGLNYVVVEGARIDDISRLFGIRNTDILQVNLTEGLGFGALYPKTNTKLLNKERYDEFHIAGTGVNAKAGLHLTFFKYFLIIGELKGGYINMYDVRTTYDIVDKAKHDFLFFETVLGIGGTFRF
ncbi:MULTISPECIES: hypothetical protein [Capnocytophaga]|jgi:hypothetical protein|uniref:hypothetical protein n=1 Tax=Capnocytophaga TaxID=1016 RepID=UPI0002A3423B|nr:MULTISPECIES: hypothetical protein [Capnocytophaga]EKY10203.1 hypothetical protein HMPREF9078_00191 [Capnocytophaga sp. oral taxon 380 str. F0488]UZD35461.1 hypothetical protein OLG90_07130 [Capnocytophaga ochracea]